MALPATKSRVNASHANYGVTVKFVFLVTPPPTAEMVTAIFAPTAFVCTVKFAELTPATTVTLAGTVATAVLPLARLIRTPPAGAGPFSFTVPCDEAPPLTLFGSKLTADINGGFTVSGADTLLPP